MKLIKGDVVINFTEEDVKALMQTSMILEDLETFREELIDTNYNTDFLDDYYDELIIKYRDLDNLIRDIKQQNYAITISKNEEE